MRTVLAKDGSVRYYIVVNGAEKRILTASGSLLGVIVNGKTFDSQGRIVSHGEDISALTENI